MAAAPILLHRTPHQILGPFYPVAPPPGVDHNMWSHGPAFTDASPRTVEVIGRLLDVNGGPVVDAVVEAWQADEAGHYRHPSASPVLGSASNFIGYAKCRTDCSGSYRFVTRKPGPYGEGLRRRAPHIHFQVTGTHDRLVTQMYFPNEPLNTVDTLYRAASRPALLVASLRHDDPDALRFHWDIVLARG